MGMKAFEFSINSVTIEDVNNAIVKEEFTKLGTKLTACTLTLANGHEVVGIAGVVDPLRYDIKIGSNIAKKNAMNEVWSHLGSILQNQIAENDN